MPFVSMANAVAGQIASSSEYNKVVANVNQLNTTRTKYKKATATGVSTTVTTTAADMPGTSMTVTTSEANTVVKFTAVFDIDSDINGDVFIGTLVVDGAAAELHEAHFRGAGRGTVTQVWLITFATAASHTAKLQVKKTATASTVLAFGTHTCLVAEGQGIT